MVIVNQYRFQGWYIMDISLKNSFNAIHRDNKKYLFILRMVVPTSNKLFTFIHVVERIDMSQNVTNLLL